MAKKFTAKDQASLNKELATQDKYLAKATKQVDTMAKKYEAFADKRKKEAKEYKKHLETAEKRLEKMVEKYEEIVDFSRDLNKEQRDLNKEQKNLSKMLGDHAKTQEKDILGAAALQKFAVSKTAALAAEGALANNRLAVGQAMSSTIALDIGMLEEVKSANIDIGGLMDSQDTIADSMVMKHAEEIEMMQAASASQTEILQKTAEQAGELRDIQGLFQNQIDKAGEMNEQMSARTVAGFETREILEKQTEEFQAQQDLLDDLKNKAKKYIGIFSNGQLAFAFIANQIGQFTREMRDFANSTGVSLGNSAKLVGQSKILNVTMAGMGIEQEHIIASQQAMLNIGMSMKDLTMENVKQTTLLAERFGMGADSAAQFRKDLMMMSGGSEKLATNLQSSAIALAKANGMAPGKLLGIMADNAEEFARFGKKGFASVAKAAIAAKKLGVEFSSIVEAGRGLLDIETSIEKEMEASVLIGRELNLNAAREAALKGDHLELTKQLTKQVGSLEEFQGMNVVQQQALADAMGMSVGEITNIMGNQDKLNDLSEAGLEHYKETGEIAEQQEGILARVGMFLGENAEMSAAIVGSMGSWKKELGGILGFVGKLGKSAMNKIGFGGQGDMAKGPLTKGGKPDMRFNSNKMPKAPTKLPSTKGGEGAPGMMKGLSKLKMKDVVAGAAAMVLVAAAVFVFAKAVKEFMGVSWEAVGMAVVSMLALVGAVALLGMIMMSGVGALAIIAGAAAMLIVAAAMLVLAYALKIVSEAIPNFLLLIPMLPQLAIGMMMMYPAIPAIFALGFALPFLGFGLAIAAAGFAVFDKAGGAATLTALGESLPALAGVGEGMVAASIGMLAIGLALPSLGFGLLLAAAGFGLFHKSGGAEVLLALGESLPALSDVGEGLVAAGAGVLAIGVGLLPFALAMAIMAEYIPLLPMLAEGFAIMSPPLVALSAVGEGLLISAMALGVLGYSLIPFAFGMSLLAEFVPLIPIMAAGLVTMAPALLMMAPIAETFQTMGEGFFAIGTGLAPLAVSMAILYPYVDGLPVVAQAMIDMAPPLILMSPYGPQIMFLGKAIGVLGLTTALAAVPLLLFGAAAYYTAPAVELLGKASVTLGVGMERVATPLLAMAAQFPSIFMLGTSLFALAGSFLAAMFPTLGFGAAAMFAAVGIGMMAASLTLLVGTASGLAQVGAGLSLIASGLADVSEYKGTLAMLTIAAPILAIAGLTGMFGGSDSGGEKGTNGTNGTNGDESTSKPQKIDTTALEAKIDQLITIISKGGVINMDGRKVGEVLNLAKGPVGA